jgi:hypothetical protein
VEVVVAGVIDDGAQATIPVVVAWVVVVNDGTGCMMVDVAGMVLDEEKGINVIVVSDNAFEITTCVVLEIADILEVIDAVGARIGTVEVVNDVTVAGIVAGDGIVDVVVQVEVAVGAGTDAAMDVTETEIVELDAGVVVAAPFVAEIGIEAQLHAIGGEQYVVVLVVLEAAAVGAIVAMAFDKSQLVSAEVVVDTVTAVVVVTRSTVKSSEQGSKSSSTILSTQTRPQSTAAPSQTALPQHPAQGMYGWNSAPAHFSPSL